MGSIDLYSVWPHLPLRQIIPGAHKTGYFDGKLQLDRWLPLVVVFLILLFLLSV